MPIHDWTRVDAGTFHAFQTVWISEMMKALNDGILPKGYYALAEQVATRMQTDVLTLHLPKDEVPSHGESAQGGTTLAEAAPQARLAVRPDPKRKPRRPIPRMRHLVVRHISGHHVVALIEIVSPSNKDRRMHVRELAEKVVRSLEAGIHVLLLDLIPPGRHDPHGLHGAVWHYYDTISYDPPLDDLLTLASYVWDGIEPKAFIEPVRVGRSLIEMPLFLSSERYVNVPLERTYSSAYRGMPEFWRRVLEGVPNERPS